MTDSAEVSTISEISSGTATLDLSDLHGNTGDSSKDDELKLSEKVNKKSQVGY